MNTRALGLMVYTKQATLVNDIVKKSHNVDRDTWVFIGVDGDFVRHAVAVKVIALGQLITIVIIGIGGETCI